MARKKSRTDNQVYKVTKSKLDLALEKIDVLEKKLEVKKPKTTPEPAKIQETMDT